MSTVTTLISHSAGSSDECNKARKKTFGKEEIKLYVFADDSCLPRKSQGVYKKSSGTNKWVQQCQKVQSQQRKINYIATY